jgi:hypothetical protein
MPLPTSTLDYILTLQLAIAWAGETETEPPRLGWWRTGMVDPDGGEDLFQRLAPKTWRWAVLQAAREAARRVDADARARAADPDRLYSLFRFGFKTDEQIAERLSELKRDHEDPRDALPLLSELMTSWDRAALTDLLTGLADAPHTATPTGRLIKGDMPAAELAAKKLAAALLPLSDRYPAPHYLADA